MYLYELQRLTNSNLVPLLKFAGEGFESPELVIDEEVRSQLEEYLDSVEEKLQKTAVENVIFGWIKDSSREDRLFDFVIMYDFIESLLGLGFSLETASAIRGWEKIQEVGKSSAHRELAFQEAMRFVYPLAA